MRAWPCLLALACGDVGDPSKDAIKDIDNPPVQSDTDTDVDTDTDADTDTDVDTDTDTDADTDTPTGAWPAYGFAPYVDATLYPTARIADIADTTGLSEVVLGFVVDADGASCTPSWGGFYDLATGPASWDKAGKYTLYAELDALRAAGGDAMVSLGGAAGTPLAAACADEDALAAAYLDVVDTLDLVDVDFDVEGAWLADAASVARRAAATATLQAERAATGRPLAVWLTLPVLPTGLTPDGVAVVEATLDAGVELAGVNVMAMDYGDAAAPDPDGQMGAYAILAAEAARRQLKDALLARGVERSEAELWAMTGVTPMIGLNDVTTEVFTLTDAAEVRAWADDHAVGRLSFWSLNRDHPCPDQTWVGTDCSSSPDQVDDHAFTAVFVGYDGPG